MNIGRFRIVYGKDVGVRPTHIAYEHYIVIDENNQCIGHYPSPMMAEALARGLTITEQKQIDKEMDDLLARKED